jgi:hypothetical protein
MPTPLTRDAGGFASWVIRFALSFPRLLNWLDPAANVSKPSASAATLNRLILDRSFADTPAKSGDGAVYFKCDGSLIETQGEANDRALARELWEDSAKVLGLQTAV